MKVYLIETFDLESSTIIECYKDPLEAVKRKIFIQKLIDAVEGNYGFYDCNYMLAYKLREMFYKEYGIKLLCVSGVRIQPIEVL